MLIQSSGRMVNSVDVEHHTSLEFSPYWVLFVAMLSITLIYSITIDTIVWLVIFIAVTRTQHSCVQYSLCARGSHCH